MKIRTFVDDNKQCPWCIKNGIKIAVMQKSVRLSCSPQKGEKCSYYAWIPKSQLTPKEVFSYYRGGARDEKHILGVNYFPTNELGDD